MATRRPPLNRGHSMPTYPGSQIPSSYATGGVESSLARLTLAESRNNTIGSRAGETMRRGGLSNSASEGSRPSTPLLSFREPAPDVRAHYPTPPHSASFMTSGSSPYPPPSPPGMPRSKSHSSQPPSSSSNMSSYVPPPTNLPAVTSPPANSSSALLRNRAIPHQSGVTLKIDNTPNQYTLFAPLGNGFSSDSITIAARKGNVIVVVADRWDQEQDCHHEWQVQFDKDADMSSIHATFENGLLKVTVKRLAYYSGRS